MLQVSERQRVASAQSLMLGEEASSNKLNLFYANMRHQLASRQKRAGSATIPTKGTSATEQLKLALRREQSDFALPPRAVSRNPLLQAAPLNIAKKKKAASYSNKERLILALAFKKFEDERRAARREPKKMRHEVC